MLVRCRYQCSHAGRLGRGGHVDVGADEAVGVDGRFLLQLRERQRPLVRVQGAAPPRPGVGRDLIGVQLHPADQQHGAFRPVRRPVRGDGGLGVLHVDRVPPGRLRMPASAFHMLVIRLAPIANTMPSAAAARASSPAKYPASARSAIFRPACAARARTPAAAPAAPGPAAPPRMSGGPGRRTAGPPRAGSPSRPRTPRAAGPTAAPDSYRPRRVSCCRRPPRRWRRCRP